MTVDDPIMVKYSDIDLDTANLSRNEHSNMAKRITDLWVPKSAKTLVCMS